MFEKLHKTLLKKSLVYAKWHKNPLHTIVHFIILVILVSIFAFYIQTGLEQGVYYHLVSQNTYAKAALEPLSAFSQWQADDLMVAGYKILLLVFLLLFIFSIAAFFVFLR